jgi:hypothetical protein
MILTGSEELEKFYKNKFYFSYSSINKLLFSPIAFYSHYVLQQREDSTDAHLVAGRALHCLLLEPEKFNDLFLTLPGKIPTDNQKKIIDNIFKYHLSMGNNTLTLEDYSDEILTHLLTANLYQTLKTDQQRLDKILTAENIEYFAFLKASLDRTVIDQATLDGCNVSLQSLKSNSDVRALFQLDISEDSTHIDVLNERLFTTDRPELPFGFKGIIDNVVIDHEAKIIFINDLKTTGKSIQDFPESVEYYKYWIQAVIYSILVTDNILVTLPDAPEWKIQVTFIVIDKYNQIYPFQVSRETLVKWADSFKVVIGKVEWHYNNRRFDLPYELASGNLML